MSGVSDEGPSYDEAVSATISDLEKSQDPDLNMQERQLHATQALVAAVLANAAATREAYSPSEDDDR